MTELTFKPDFHTFYVNSEKAFSALTPDEKQYAYYLNRVSWAGAAILFNERCYDGIPLSFLFTKVFALDSIESLEARWLAKDSSNTKDEYDMFITYCCAFLSSFGYFTPMGSVKFTPNLSQEKFLSILHESNFYRHKP